MSDKKGKGSGTKDACYHKVKARYSVWPSAYASGALVKCRKKGAANWGNSTKKESFEIQDGVSEGAMPEPIDPKKHKDAQKKQKMRNLAVGNDNPNEKKVAEKKAGGPKLMGEGKYSKSETYVKGTAPVRATYGGKTESFPKETYKKKSKISEGDKYDNLAKDISRVKLLSNAKPPADPKKTAEKKARLEKKRGMKLDDHPQYKKEEVEQIEEKKKSGDPCWVGYKQVGMKKKGGKMVPNCVPEETEVSEGKKEMLAKMNASREGFMAKDGPNKAAHDAKQRILKKTKEKMTEEIVQSIFEKCWAGYEKKGMKTMFGKRYPNCVKKKATRKEEVEVDEKYQGMYQSPAPTYNRLKSSDEKARMSPGRRAMAKSDELEKSEPGSKRAKAQKKASMQMARNFKSARATKEEFELDERTRYAKETGKDPQTGKPSVKGGEKPSGAFAAVSKELRKSGGLMSSRKKAIQPQGKKKVPGAKGLKGTTPVDKIKAKLAQQRAPKPNPYKPRAGESD